MQNGAGGAAMTVQVLGDLFVIPERVHAGDFVLVPSGGSSMRRPRPLTAMW
jgi:hypothetical protein